MDKNAYERLVGDLLIEHFLEGFESVDDAVASYALPFNSEEDADLDLCDYINTRILRGEVSGWTWDHDCDVARRIP